MTEILKDNVAAFPIFLGGRLLDNRDMQAFCEEIVFKKFYQEMFFSCFDKAGKELDFATVAILQKLDLILKNDNEPLAIFLVLSMMTAGNTEKINELVKDFSGLRENIFVYPVIWDVNAAGFEIFKDGTAAHVYFEGDSQTAGARRLRYFMSHMMGYDLESELFPNYDMEVAVNMGKHINRMGFNSFMKREGSIPPWPIRDGKPYFPIFEVEAECPECGTKTFVQRADLDGKGGGTLNCRYFCGKESYLKDVGDQFDDCPEFDVLMKEEE